MIEQRHVAKAPNFNGGNATSVVNKVRECPRRKRPGSDTRSFYADRTPPLIRDGVPWVGGWLDHGKELLASRPAILVWLTMRVPSEGITAILEISQEWKRTIFKPSQMRPSRPGCACVAPE